MRCQTRVLNHRHRAVDLRLLGPGLHHNKHGIPDIVGIAFHDGFE